MSRYVDLDGISWDGKPIASKIQEVKNKTIQLGGFKMERVIKNKSVASALRIIELYKECDKIDREGLIMCFWMK